MTTEIRDDDLIIPARFGSDFLVDDPEFDLHNADKKLPSLVLTRAGNIFDGIIRQALIGDDCIGLVFGSERFADRSSVQTSQIIKVGIALPFGCYVETVTGSRYLVSALYRATGAAHWAIMKARALAADADYFGPKQWSHTVQITDETTGGAHH